MSTSPLPDHSPAPAPGQGGGLAHFKVIDMVRSLDFYLNLGCEVRCAADGWVLLAHGGQILLVLTAATPGPGWSARSQPHRQRAGSTLQVRLGTPDLRALRRRLLAAGVPAGAILRTVHAPAGEIEISDPDGHLVAIEQL